MHLKRVRAGMGQEWNQKNRNEDKRTWASTENTFSMTIGEMQKFLF